MEIETYVTVHDQDLVLELEQTGIFSTLSHTYLFVGWGDFDRIPDTVKMIVSRDYFPNYEHLPQFYDFTGWYSLYSQRLITTPYCIMLQYDHTPTQFDAESKCLEALHGADLVGFVAGYHNNWYLQVPDFKKTLDAGSLACGVDLSALDTSVVFHKWASTQGTAWNTEYFYDFMKWFEPAFDVVRDHVLAGHIAERLLSVYTYTTNTPAYLEGLFRHGSLDCHGTGDLMRGEIDSYREKKSRFGITE